MDKTESKTESKMRQLRDVTYSAHSLRSKAPYKEISAGEIIGKANLLIKKFDDVNAFIDYQSLDTDEKEYVDIARHSVLMLNKYISVLKKCLEVFEDSDAATEWLRAEIIALGGYTPLDKMRGDEGIDLVMNELGRIEHGVVS